MPPKKRMARAVRRTILIQCEGKRDKAFLEHLRSMYCSGLVGGPDVFVREAKGKGGNNVVDTLIGNLMTRDFDLAVAFCEADVPPEPAYVKRMKALGKRGAIVMANSCLEAMLLRILGRRVPDTVTDCKIEIEQVAGSQLFAPSEYKQLWTLGAIEGHIARHDQDGSVSSLIGCYR